MAIKEQIIIEVEDKGLEAATQKANALSRATKAVTETTGAMAGEMRGASNSVLENGGAMGLLNDVTGGYAMMVKDAVEASILFTKSQRLAAIQQKAYSLAVGTSTGAMKIFRLALISTGIGAIVVALGLLIANFDKVKKAVLNLVPGLAIIGEAFGQIVDMVTDFVGVTSDATRALDKMVADSEASLKRNEHFLEANGDKFDQYTQRKIKANIEYNKKVKELAEDEQYTTEQKLKILQQFRDKADREIIKADADREEEINKKRKEVADKQAEEENKREEEAKKKRDAAIAKEKERQDAISKILEDFRKREEDAQAKSELDKINLEEKRAISELERLRATEAEKQKVREYFNALRKGQEEKLNEELAAIEVAKTEALNELALDQKEWEIENETDPATKLIKQKELLEEQTQLELDKLQRDIYNANLSATERANAEINYAKVKQDSQQALDDLDIKYSEDQKVRDEAVAQNRLSVAANTAQLIAQLAGEGSAIAKGVAVAQATIDTYKGAVSAYSAMSGIPIIGPALGAVAAGVVVAAGVANVKKILATKPVEKGSPSGGGGAAAPAAPSFNLVQGTGANQIASAIGGDQKPVQAFVVSSNVTTAQSMDRNIVENATV